MLELQNIKISIEERQLLSFDSLAIKPGDIVSLLGPSGYGKSTLLKFIAGLTDPDIKAEGTIIVNKEAVSERPTHQRRLGYVEQRPTLFPHLNVRQNLAFGLRGPSEDIDQAMEIAGLTDLALQDVATLSGGQAARVSLMRTLLSAPKALLLDEPFAALDPELRSEMRDFVFDLIRTKALPTLLVTHDIADAFAAQGPVFRLENHGIEVHKDIHV